MCWEKSGLDNPEDKRQLRLQVGEAHAIQALPNPNVSMRAVIQISDERA